MTTRSPGWTLLALFILTAGFAASSCKNKDADKSKNKAKPPTAKTDTYPAVNRAESFAIEMCACKDAVCATKVFAEFKTWAATFRKSKPGSVVIQQVTPFNSRLAACYKRLKTGAKGGGKYVEVKGGFQTPESVLFDKVGDVYLVSNINGSPFATDGNGFISRVTPDGKISSLKWIDGGTKGIELNAPKGMAILGDVLYVADITVVRRFDRKTGAPKGSIQVPGATFLNDIVAGKNAIYVSDTGKKKGFANSGTDAVYEIKGDKVKALIKDPKLGNPNGLAVIGKDVWVVNFGNHELYKVVGGKKTAVVNLPEPGLDGVEPIHGGEVLISSWKGGAIYRGKLTGPFKVLIKGLDKPADIGWDSKRKRVLVPLFGLNIVQIHTIK